MFGWLKNLFRRDDSADVYRPGERLLYRYFDGQKEVAADPLELYLRVMEVGPELAVDVQVAESPFSKVGDAAPAHRKRVEKVRKIFGVKPLEEGGLSGIELAELLDHFLLWSDRLKKNSGPTPTPAAATPAATPSSSAASPATGSSSASGSTAAGPTCGPPVSSSTAPASPSA